MSQWYLNLWVMVGSTLWVLGCIQPIAAQVIPDNTLPALERSQVSGNPNFQINGGARRGGNLFHSFQSFSVPTGGSAYFNNAADVQNIFSRVTGGSISNIDGVIRANGTANLFLLNPNGIVFNAGASLDIAGSFVTSTASSLKFANGFEFSATNPQSAPLLSINVPTGLQYGVNPGAIQVKGDGQGQLIDNTFGLRVQSNQTLALVGGDVSLEGATLFTNGGRIELGSVAGEGLVDLTFDNKSFFLGYDAVPNFGNIQLSQQATVDASGAGGGNIQVQGKRITLGNGSQIEANTLGARQGGSLVVHATDLLEVIGTSNDGQYPSSLLVQAEGTGNAGELRIDTQKLLIQDGAQVDASTYGAGKGGNLFVTADSVQVIGESKDSQYSSSLSTEANYKTIGNAGELRIDTQKLLIQDGAQVSTATFGAGNSGNLFVTADSVQVIGTSNDSQYPSALTVQTQGKGNAGELRIDTHQLLIQDAGFVSANSFGVGKGGNLFVTADSVQVVGESKDGRSPSGLTVVTTDKENAGELRIDTRQLLIQDGGEVDAGTLGAGSGGNLFVTADSVQVIGRSKDGQYGSALTVQTQGTGDAGELRINTRQLLIQDGAFVSASTFRGGNGGNLFVTADSIQLIGISKDGRYSSSLSVKSQSTGNAGSLFVTADSLHLYNGAKINADTTGGGGNIFLRTPLLILRDRSSITTNATGANIPGGNITIDAANGFIIAVPQENSDISANSLDFRGGRVAINAQSIFGMQYRSNIQTPQSDITATGASPQFSGSVQINTPDVDPNSGLVQLPADFVDRSGLIAQGCPANKGNSFTITGRGGLPPLPSQALRTNQTATVDWVTLNPQEQKSTNVTENSHLGRGLWHKNRKLEVQQINTPIVEATGWVINKSGAVELTTRTNALNSAIASGGTSLRDATLTSIAACPSPAAAIQK